LNGTLTDAEGNLVPNEAVPDSRPGGAYFTDTVNFERDAAPFDVMDLDNNFLASFFPGLFPGIPSATAHADNFATEVITYLELPAGETKFGISVGTDRTDVNNDDSFQVFTGENPRDYFSTKVAEFQRSAPPFVSNTHGETQFTLDAP